MILYMCTLCKDCSMELINTFINSNIYLFWMRVVKNFNLLKKFQLYSTEFSTIVTIFLMDPHI